MTTGQKDQVKGLTFLVVFIGIPLTFFFGPVPLIIMIVFGLLGLIGKHKENIAPQKTKSLSKRTKLSQDDEELITAILPVINNHDK